MTTKHMKFDVPTEHAIRAGLSLVIARAQIALDHLSMQDASPEHIRNCIGTTSDAAYSVLNLTPQHGE